MSKSNFEKMDIPLQCINLNSEKKKTEICLALHFSDWIMISCSVHQK